MATVDGDLVVSALATPEGNPVDVAAVLTAHGVQVGEVVQGTSPALLATVADLEPRLARDESFWLDRLTVAEPSSPALFGRAGDSARDSNRRAREWSRHGGGASGRRAVDRPHHRRRDRRLRADRRVVAHAARATRTARAPRRRHCADHRKSDVRRVACRRRG